MNRTLHIANNAQKILQVTADTMLLIDRNGVCIDIDTHSDLWFLQTEVLLDKNIFELLPEHTREKIIPIFQTVLYEQKKISKNFKLELKEETYYFKCIMQPYEGMVLCQYRDITQRSNVKRLLEQANRNLREIQKAAQIGQWTYNTYDNIFHYLGHTEILCVDDVQSIPIDKYEELIVEEDLPIFIEWRQRNQESSNEESISYRVRIQGSIYYVKIQTYSREACPNGSFNIEGYIQNITDIQSTRNHITKLTHDINENRERYEAEIKRLNLILNTTIDNLPAAIVIKDADNDFRYIYRNQESYNRETFNNNAIGMNDFDFYPTEIATIKRQEDIEVATTGEGLHWTTEGKDKNGKELILDKRKIRVGGNELFSPIIISIEWDITELEIIKRELQASKEKAELSDKLKSAFLANMSHEIRTPLNAIVGFSHLIAESADAEERKTYYNIVEANNERLLQLINEILDLSKIESGIVEFTYAPVNLNNLCKEVHDAHVFRTPQGVKLIYEQSNDRLMIDSDKNRIFQVFSNLIGNAFKFTKEGSVSYGFKLKGNTIVFHVTDTGTGIEPEKLGRVFERFAKLNNYAQGTGLGLSICKTIIERLGGEIGIASEVGKGTSFTFTLPYKSIESAESVSSIESTHEDSTQNTSAMEEISVSANLSPEKKTNDQQATILIAEDTDSNFDLLNAILGRTYKLLRARDGMEAVTMYDAAQPDLILMDIKMPNLDGLEATKIIRELSASVPIIAQSAYAFEHDRKAAEDAGCNDFITKPISKTILKEVLSKWLP